MCLLIFQDKNRGKTSRHSEAMWPSQAKAKSGVPVNYLCESCPVWERSSGGRQQCTEMENHGIIKCIVGLLLPALLNTCPVVASSVERTGQVGLISSLGRSGRRLCLSIDLLVTAFLSSLQLLYIHMAGWDSVSLKRKKKMLCLIWQGKVSIQDET